MVYFVKIKQLLRNWKKKLYPLTRTLCQRCNKTGNRVKRACSLSQKMSKVRWFGAVLGIPLRPTL